MKQWMKKSLAACLALVMCLTLAACGGKEGETPAEESVNVRVAALKGPTAMGMVKLMSDYAPVEEALEDKENVVTAGGGNTYEFTLAASADEVSPKLMQGELDIACEMCIRDRPGVLDDLGRVKIFFCDGLHRRQLPVGQLPRRGGALHAFTGGFRGIFFGTVLRRFRLYSQQGADGDAKDPAHGDQVLQFRHGGVRLPLAHRLAADAQPLPQGFLREAGGLSGLLDAAAQGLLLPHGINSFALTIPESGKKRNHRRVSQMSTTGCGWEKENNFP